MAVTNAAGQYRFPNLPPGDYTLTVELPGFGTYIEEGMQVLVGGTTERVVTLGLATVAETVTVTGESPVVDTRKSGVSTNFSNEYMENTPLRRFSFFDFTKSAPGMSATNPTSGTSSRVSAFGSGVDENKYLMDGVDFTAPVSGAAWPWPDTDVIEEMEVISLGASAEYGNSPGAVFNVVTKQGTNNFAADAAYFGMWDALTSKPIRLNADGDEDPNGWGFKRNKYVDVTAHVGGPIIRDRAWIYGGYQYLADWDNQPGTDPQFPRKFGAHRMFWKLTADLTPNMKFMHTYHDDIWVIPATPSLTEPFESIATWSGKNPSVTFGRITHVLSANTFYEVGVSGFYSPRDLSESNSPGVPRRNDIDNGFASGGYGWYDIFKQARTEVKAKVSHFASDWMGADHDFKFGVQHVIGNHSSHGGYVPGPNYPGGVIYYDHGDGTPYYILTGSTYNKGGEFRETGVFAEDIINIGNRITVQAGIRFDRVRGISQDVDDLLVNDLAALTFDSIGTVQGRGELFEWTNWGAARRIQLQTGRRWPNRAPGELGGASTGRRSPERCPGFIPGRGCLKSSIGIPTPGATTSKDRGMRRRPTSGTTRTRGRHAPTSYQSVSIASWPRTWPSRSPTCARTRTTCSAGTSTLQPTAPSPISLGTARPWTCIRFCRIRTIVISASATSPARGFPTAAIRSTWTTTGSCSH